MSHSHNILPDSHGHSSQQTQTRSTHSLLQNLHINGAKPA
jgi:hypothetical protein